MARRSGRWATGIHFVVRALPNPLFNDVMGLTTDTVGQLGELAGWYADHGRSIRVEVTPAQGSPELFAALVRHGLH